MAPPRGQKRKAPAAAASTEEKVKVTTATKEVEVSVVAAEGEDVEQVAHASHPRKGLAPRSKKDKKDTTAAPAAPAKKPGRPPKKPVAAAADKENLDAAEKVPTSPPKKAAAGKRKAVDTSSTSVSPPTLPAPSVTETATEEKTVGRPAKRPRGKASMNDTPARPDTPYNVYVFGKGEMAELGLGPSAAARVVKRPRLNHFLLPEKVGVVQMACGGMHSLALTKDGKVYSWGVNDQGALGRDTNWEAPVKEADASDSEDEDVDINPLESTPGLVIGFPPNINIVQVAAGDSISVAVTADGFVYAWGTFRCADGILGFSEKSRVATRPEKIPQLKDVVNVVTGTDHILALTRNGKVFAWGNGQQFQLGRRVVERTRLNGLSPREFGLKNIKLIGCGSYHSFALDADGKVWAWGVNQYAQCGLYDEDDSPTGGALIPVPTHVKALDGYEIVHITGGEHHSAAVTKDGDLLMWGRIDANQLGLDRTKIDQTLFVKDVSGKDRFLTVPTKIPDMKFSWVGCGTHHNVAISRADGSAWSWGFGESYQVGLGPAVEDVEFPTQIVNTATKGVKMVWSGCGGQFSVLMGNPEEADGQEKKKEEQGANGVNGAATAAAASTKPAEGEKKTSS